MNEKEIQNASGKNTSPSYCFLKLSFLIPVDFCNCTSKTTFEEKCAQRTQKTLSLKKLNSEISIGNRNF